VEFHTPSRLPEEHMLESRRPRRTPANEKKSVAVIILLVLLTAVLSAEANAQDEPTDSNQISATPISTPISNTSNQDDADQDFRLGAATAQTFGFTVFQHLVRLREKRTRQELGGAFFHDWLKAASHTGRNWDDGGKFFTNYVAHPMGGAIYADIYRQNNPREKHLEIGDDGYGRMLARAMLFSAVASAQFEIGPVSEASIGNVGMRNPKKMAWGDFVVTPVLGTVWMLGEDVIDQRLLKRMDGTNVVLRNTLRFFLNPSRTGANLSRRKWPWYRDRDV